MNKQDIDAQRKRWAEQHDWFVSAVRIPGTACYLINCETQEVDRGRNVTDVQAQFENFAKLRAWAGY